MGEAQLSLNARWRQEKEARKLFQKIETSCKEELRLCLAELINEKLNLKDTEISCKKKE